MSSLITIRQWLASKGLAFISDVKLYELSQKLVLEIPRAKLAANWVGLHFKASADLPSSGNQAQVRLGGPDSVSRK